MNLRDHTFGFIHEAARVQQPESLLDELLKACEPFEIDGVFMADVPDPGMSIEPHILLRGWSNEWIERYATRNYVHTDPVANLLRRQTEPFLWSEACDRSLERHESIVMEEAREFGLSSGLSVPIFGVSGRQCCVSFSGQSIKVTSDQRAALHMMAIYAHGAMDRLRPRRKLPRLTRRELECLQWSSLGKTSWEIGTILGVNKRTVDDHLESASSKMNCSTRPHAVAQAVRYGLIN